MDAKPETKPDVPDQGKEFVEEYQKLCEKYGLILAAKPEWILRDDNTYSFVLKTYIDKYKKNA